MQKTAQKFIELIDTMNKLRAECPWDKKQTPESLRQYILEEAYEVIETIDQKNWQALSHELGDLLLQIVFQCTIAQEKNRFSMQDVISHINHKLIERHPHVFSDTSVNNAEDVAENWESIKINAENRSSLLSGIPENAPALLRAQRLQQKAAFIGFDWTNISDVITKVEEEIREFKSALARNNKEHIGEELGDLLFSIVNLSRFIDVVAEDALRLTNKKFIKRFQKIEAHYKHDINALKNATLEELDDLWNKAKESE